MIKIRHFADFKQVIIKITHFADFKQVIIKISQFTDIEQVITKISHQQNSLGRNWMPRHFFFWGHCPVSLALHRGFSDLWRSPPALSSTPTLVFLFECLGILFFHSSHLTYGTPCRAKGHSHSPKEAEDFSRGDNHSKHMHPLTYLARLQPMC